MKTASDCAGVSMLTKAMLLCACAIAPSVSLGQTSMPPPDDKAVGGAPSEEHRQTLYALGVIISRNLDDFHLTPEEFERVKAGLVDGFDKRSVQVDLAVESPKVQALRQSRLAAVVKRRQEDGQVYLDHAAAEPKATRTASGLVLIPLRAGQGARPGRDDEVSVNYRGKLIDGTVFDASKDGPSKFLLNAVIPCWTEALQLMRVGEKARLVCPPALAYAMRGSPPKIASQSTLDFDVELVGVSAVSAAAKVAR